MAIHAEAVEILVRKGRFEPEVALGVAEAVEVSLTLAQWVTVPVLDARLRELRHEFKTDIQMLRGEIQVVRVELKSELVTEVQKLRTEMHKLHSDLTRWVFLTMLGNVALSMSANVILKAFGS